MANNNHRQYDEEIAQARARAEWLAAEGRYEEAFYQEELVTEMGQIAADRITQDAKQELNRATSGWNNQRRS